MNLHIVQIFQKNTQSAESIILENLKSIEGSGPTYTILDLTGSDDLITKIKKIQETEPILSYVKPEIKSRKSALQKFLKIQKEISKNYILILEEFDILNKLELENLILNLNSQNQNETNHVFFVNRKINNNSKNIISLKYDFIFYQKILEKILEANDNFDMHIEHLFLSIKKMNLKKIDSNIDLISVNEANKFMQNEMQKFTKNKNQNLKFFDLKIAATKSFFEKVKLYTKKSIYNYLGRI